MNKLNIVATCTFGLERALKREIIDLGYDIDKVEDGKIYFKGNYNDMMKANLHLRCADRVLIFLTSFDAFSFDELFDKTKDYPWENIFDKNAGFNIKIKRIDTFISIKDVDLKIKIIYDDNFYCKSKEFEAFLGLKGIYYCDDFYYIKVSNIDDLNKCIEFVDIIYDEKFKNKKNLVRVT